MNKNQKLDSFEYLDFNPDNIITSGNNRLFLENIPTKNKISISSPNLNTSLLNKIQLDFSSNASLIHINNHSAIISHSQSLFSFVLKTNSATSGDTVNILNDLNNYVFEESIIGENEEDIIFDKKNIPNSQNNEINNIK